MKHYRNFLTLDGLLLITIGWLSLLSILFEFASVASKHPGSLRTAFFNYNVESFNPPVTLTDWNHLFIVVSAALFAFGMKAVLSNRPKLEQIFLGGSALFFLAQTVGLVMFGLYPLPAGYSAIFTGYSLYLLTLRLREWTQK